MADEATILLKSFAHPARLLICCQLRDREMSVSEIEQSLDIRQPRLSRELAKLREEGMVETRREAKSVYYTLSTDQRVRGMMDAICAVMLGKPGPAAAAPSRGKKDAPGSRMAKQGGSSLFARVRTEQA
ncbi:hypothetical protein GCM10011342_15570 [Aquisalinus flavus]|uniref:HTH arsR-type domain-containing protein n=2 Tax=Aquisalinus flavus TaxID=1526572 RepID=A0A8J2V4E8_9PROT|nr:hypothetical protein GCM10011342_15570 [Aquisalinus flavus]